MALKLPMTFVACRCGELLPLFEVRCHACGLPHPHVLRSDLGLPDDEAVA